MWMRSRLQESKRLLCDMRLAILCLFCFYTSIFGCCAQTVISKAIVVTEGEVAKEIVLPSYFEGTRTGIKSIKIRYVIPQNTSVSASDFYAILFPYPIQGGQVFLNGKPIYALEHSDDKRLFNWYRPITINLPLSQWRADGDNVVEFHQVGHLRVWPLLPLFFGTVSQLREVHDVLFYVSQTLASIINLFCAVGGFFLLALGLKTGEKKYAYPGVAALFWVSLFTIAFLPVIEASDWFVWRLSLYFLTGNVILFSSLFLIHIFRIDVSRRAMLCMAGLCQLGWFGFLLSPGRMEYALDVYWTASVVLIYVTFIFKAFFSKTHVHRLAMLMFLIYLLISAVFAIHDFLLQAGIVILRDVGGDAVLSVIANAVYLSDFSLPAFLFTAGFFLFKEFSDNRRRLTALIAENTKIRESIISDIHDGVGARLNVLLLGVEMGNFKSEDLLSDIRQCVQELRFVLAPEEAKVSFLMNLILNFCHEFKAKLEYKNIEFYFLINYKDDSKISPRVALVVYWITLECLSNVIKHAVSSCTRVSYVLNIDAHLVSLLVEDDGPGIRGWRDANQSVMLADARVGLGLKSLINRAKSVGGSVWIASGPKTGTVVSASFETAVSPT